MTDPASDQQAWLSALAGLQKRGDSCVVVTVTGVRGSAPREPGARLIAVDGRLAWGTIGGGQLEHIALRDAESIRAANGRVETREYPLSEKVGQCCGGVVTLFFEVFRWQRRHVTVFGAGHVAQAFAALAPWMRAEVLLIDPRSEEEIAPPLPSERAFEVLFVDAPEAEVPSLPAASAVLIMTHDHALDLAILAAVLQRGGFPYVGLIGSARKWERFKARLLQRGISPAQLGGVHCPIGGARTSKEPAAIALQTAAEVCALLDSLPAQMGSG